MYENKTDIFNDIPELKQVETREEGSRREIKSYVLRGSHLHPYQLQALREYYPQYGIPFSGQPLVWKDVFGNDNPVIVEIGFGMADSTVRIAKERSQYNYLGIEVFLSGFSKLMHECGTVPLPNVRAMRHDAVQVLQQMIPDGSVEGFHIFFPDPWPKKKHHKRRLIQQPLVNLLAQKLRKGGYIYCATDWAEYADQMLEVLGNEPLLHNAYAGFAPSRPWRPLTKFEQKGLDQSFTIREVWFEKL